MRAPSRGAWRSPAPHHQLTHNYRELPRGGSGGRGLTFPAGRDLPSRPRNRDDGRDLSCRWRMFHDPRRGEIPLRQRARTFGWHLFWEPMGAEAILRQDPHARPNQTKRSPAPACHAATKGARERFWEAYSAFVAAFREAADKLKAGDWTARFPVGSFPPALPFVSAYPSLPP